MLEPEPKTRIDVKKSEQVKQRLDKVSRALDNVGKGEYAEIISDDERMLHLAPRMIRSIGKARFVRTWLGDDDYYHTLVKKE